MKKTLVMTLLASTLVLTGCQVKTNQDSKSKETTTITEKSSKTRESKTAESNETTSSEETQRVGSETQGYIDVPADWITFKDVSGSEAVQFTDPEKPGFAIVTLDVFDKERLGVDSMSEVTAEDVAKSLAASLDEGGSAKEISGAMTTVAGYEAYQVNVTMTSGQLLTTWTFKTKDDGNVYYIAMEGDEEALSEMTPYIEGTWSETKS